MLQGIDFGFAQGERVALVGASGSGKTTVARLLLGFDVPETGRICVNGIDLRDFTAAGWFSRIAWMVISPPPGIACCAFSNRFSKACLNISRSSSTGGRSLGK